MNTIAACLRKARDLAPIVLVAVTAWMAAPAAAQEYTEAWRTAGFVQPESVSYDSGTGTLFVSNINSSDFTPNGMGYISQLSLTGEVMAERFVEGLNLPKGTDVRDGTLWVATEGLVEIDIATAAVRNTYTSADLAFPNDVFAAEDGRVFVSDTFGGAIFVLENGELKLWLRDPQLAGANGLTVVGNTMYVATLGDVSGGFENVKPSNIKAVDLTTMAITDYGSADPIGILDGLEAMGDGMMVTDNGGGRLLRVGPDGAVTELATPGSGAADFEYIPDEGLVVIPMLNTGDVVALRAADVPAPNAQEQNAQAQEAPAPNAQGQNAQAQEPPTPNAQAQTPPAPQMDLAAGKLVWVNGGCASCHGAAGQGGTDPDFPAGPSLRTSPLDRDGLIETIACGRPGSQMPAWLRGAYTAEPCFGLPLGPPPARTLVAGAFDAGQIAALTDFIMAEFMRK